MKQREKRNILIGILCVMVVFMSVGYAVLSQNLKINGTANITGSWKIEITSISPQNINEGESVSTEILPSKTEGSFEANLKKPTDAVIYTVTVENKGTIDAVLESITPEDYTEGDIKYTTTGKEDCKNLNSGATCDFTIKVEYVDTGLGQLPTPNGTKVEQEFTIKYVQKTSGGNNGQVTPDGEGDIIVGEEELDFTLASDGTLLTYNPDKAIYDSEGYLVVPATNEEGKPIKSIINSSFVTQGNVIEIHSDDEGCFVILDEENFDEIEQVILENNVSSGSITEEDIAPRYTLSEMQNRVSNIADLESSRYYVDIEEREIGDSFVSTIEKLDLTQAVNLTTIAPIAFVETPLSHIKFGNGLTTIGSEAFYESNLTGEIIIPASVNEIGYGAFAENPNLTKITVKKADSTGMTLEEEWNGNAEVVYDPN